MLCCGVLAPFENGLAALVFKTRATTFLESGATPKVVTGLAGFGTTNQGFAAFRAGILGRLRRFALDGLAVLVVQLRVAGGVRRATPKR